MNRRQFIQASLTGVLATACKSAPKQESKGDRPDVVVLGFDGVDPRLLGRWMDAGDLPNLQILAKEGGLHALGSTSPPNSPVAWSTFATGLHPSQHGVFGFLRRDPKTYLPGTAPYTIKPPRFGPDGYREPTAVSNRRGDAFWETLDSRGVPTTLLFMPYAYPPPELKHGRVLSGLGTPDLRFTNSSFTLFTTERSGGSDRVAGGRIVHLNPRGSKIETRLEGSRGPGGKYLRVPLRLELDRKGGSVRIHLSGKSETLKEGKRSGWFPIRFEAGDVVLQGRVRFHLLAVKKEISLYATPIQMDPNMPALPLGAPSDWVQKAVEVHGGLPTLGWVHDTAAVNAGVLPKNVFLGEVLDTMEARADLLLRELESRFARLLMCVFTGTDRAAHIFHRQTRQPDGGPLRTVYRAMDRIVGAARKKMRPGTRLLVLSDHGFHAFDRMLHVNTWLESHQWLQREKPGGQVKFLRGIDWKKTKAYGLGNGQLYVNMKGRESVGVVPRGPEHKALLESIRERLLAQKDPATGQRVVSAVYAVADRAEESVRQWAPDLQIAFAPGYRSSWETSLGGAPAGEALADNPKAWCGDHSASDVKETPGALLSNAKIRHEDPALVDLASTILGLFDAPISGPGRPLLG
jgi:predicted AlkP superfamily phosphohydrolase/phosphomutase